MVIRTYAEHDSSFLIDDESLINQTTTATDEYEQHVQCTLYIIIIIITI